MIDKRSLLKDKKRIVIKIGSSSLTHPGTGNLNLSKMEKLVRMLTDLRNQGRDVPIVNENDTVATDEIEFGDNDTLSAIVAALIHADLLILLSDIDGLYTDDPHSSPDAEFIEQVDVIGEELVRMAKGSSSSVGTGGMATKISAARIATDAGADMVIANAENVEIIQDIINGTNVGTLFLAHKNKNFYLIDYLQES